MECDECGKTFNRGFNLRRHKRTAHSHAHSQSTSSASLECPICDKQFKQQYNLHRHIKDTHESSGPNFSCPQCDKSFTRKSDLTRHLQSHGRKRKPTTPGPISTAKLPRNPRQTRLRPDSLPDEDPISYSGHSTLIRDNWHYIRTHYHRGNSVQDVYNFRLNGLSSSYLNECLKRVYEVQKWKSKWSIGFGFSLNNNITNEEIYFYSSNNTRLFPKPTTITNRKDFDQLLETVATKDVQDWAKNQRPNTKFTLGQVTNMVVYITKMIPHALIGAPVQLPDYILRNKSIISLAKDYYGVSYNDSLCFFRCYACFQGCVPSRFGDFNCFTSIAYDRWKKNHDYPFEGIDLNDLEELEDEFGINIAVYELIPPATIMSPILENEENSLKTLMENLEIDKPDIISPLLQYIEDDEQAPLMPTESESEGGNDDDDDDDGDDGGGFLDRMAVDEDECRPSTSTSNENYPEKETMDALRNDVESIVSTECETLQAKNLEPIGTLIRKSRGLYANTLNLNLYQHHFSYIKNLEQYTKSWQCEKCKRLIDHSGNYVQHVKLCTGKVTEFIYKGGGYGLPKTIHEELREEALTVSNTFYPYRATFDFEARFETRPEQPNDKKLVYTQRLIPASVSISSNVPGYEQPECFINEPELLIEAMHTYLSEISEKAYQLMKEENSEVYDKLVERCNENKECEKNLTSLKRQKADPGLIQEAQGLAWEGRKWPLLLRKFDRWLKQMVVLGFNSAKFDLNLIKQYYIPYVVRNEEKVGQAIIKNNGMMSLSTDSLMFIDISNYLSPGTSYAKFIKAFGAEECKGLWPYEWFEELSQLEETQLPPPEAFYSTLRQKGVDPNDYDNLQRVWKEEGFKTMRDLLVWYNNLDVVPFLVAVQNMWNIFKEMDIDMFKGAISLPGVALQRMFKSVKTDKIVALFNEKWSWIHTMIKENIVGGPSIVFHRYHEANKTTIRGGKPVMKILGYDANSLYLWALSQKMPTGLFGVYIPESLGVMVPTTQQDPNLQLDKKKFQEMVNQNMDITFKGQSSYTFGFKELIFIEYTRRQLEHELGVEGIKIQHNFNGGQKVFQHGSSRYRVDGYIPANTYGNPTDIIIEFDGCYWHCGHNCDLTDRLTLEEYEERNAKTIKKHDFLNSLNCRVIIGNECELDEILDGGEMDEWIEENGKTRLKKSPTGQDIICGVVSKKVFGIAEVDIQVPVHNKKAREVWEELPPIFKNVDISFDDIGEEMQKYASDNELLKKPRRALISSYHGQKVLMATPLLRYLICKGCVVTRIYNFVEYQADAMFEHLGEEVADKRRMADKYPDEKIKGELYKLIGNSYYGRLLLDKTKHENVQFKTQSEAVKLARDPLFHKMDEIADGVYQVHMAKKKVVFDLPNIIPFFVYQYAKLMMLQFYNFLRVYIGKDNFQLIEMDTDSFYLALAGETLEGCVSPEKRDAFLKASQQYLAMDEYSQRTPGLFKLEWSGDGMVALNSKTYFGWTSDGTTKISTKGLSKTTNDVTREVFMGVLETKQKAGGENHGFRLNNQELVQYRQRKDALTYFYPKRKVLNDGVSTIPLDI